LPPGFRSRKLVTEGMEAMVQVTAQL
jgi:hypothetical protein